MTWYVSQVVATEKADLMEQLVGYPDWILDNAQLDAYYAGVSAMIINKHE